MIFLSQLNTALESLTARISRDERGQTASEYLGIVVVVAVIIVALATSGIGETITGNVLEKINEIFTAG